MSDIEADAVDTLIEERYALAMKVWESPWTGVKAGQENLSEIELENKFYQTYVSSLPTPRGLRLMLRSNIDRLGHSVQVAIEELRRCTTHHTFLMCGGPC